MRIKIGKVTYKNFKCFKDLTADFQYRNAVARGENGVGKTSLKDGVFWVLYDKDASGRKRFGIRPVDTNPESPKYCKAIPGLVVAVEFPMLIDGVARTFRKEQHEKIDKSGKLSYQNKYWIDDYAMPEGKYKEAMANIIPEDKFKMLTDLDYFNNDEKFGRLNRREMIVDMAGNIGTPAGFESLIARLNGHDVSEEKKRLGDHLVLLTKEQTENITRIDEKQLGLDEYARNQGDSDVEMQAKREILIEKVAGLAGKQKELLATEKNRQEIYTKINQTTNLRLHRETIVKNQSGALEDLIDERNGLEQKHADKSQALVILQSEIQTVNTNIEGMQAEITQKLLTLTSIKEEQKAAKKKPAADTCYACGQKLPADKLAENMNKREMALEDIKARGNETKEAINERKTVLLKLQDQLSDLIARRTTTVADLEADKTAKDKRIAEINEAIMNRPQADTSGDKEWQELTAQIEKLQAELGEPVIVQLEKLEAEKGLADELLRQMDGALGQADSIEKSKARIAELEARQKVLAQLIADCNKKLDEIKQFNVAQSRMVESAVNGMFDHVTYKLFDYFQNGDIDDRVCVAILDGVPYPDMSDGQKIYCNIDVRNTLSDHYGVEVPLFIDHFESLTMPLEAQSQTIYLQAVQGVKELQITLETQTEVAERKAEVA